MADYGRELQFGVFLTPNAGSADEVVALAQLADGVGLDLVTFQDHPYQGKFLDAWTLLSFVAARTTRVRLALNVTNLPLRPPTLLARAVASLDILSGGRAELGLGAGALWDRIEGLGGPRRAPGESVEALEEAIDVIRMLWDTSSAGPATFEGDHYALDGADRGPTPLHRPEIWLGAYKPRMLRLVGRKADGWLPSLGYLQPGDLARGNARIDEAARAAGRDPRDVRRLLNVPAGLGVDDFVTLALDNGVDTFILAGDDAQGVESLSRDVAPAVRRRVASTSGRRRRN